MAGASVGCVRRVLGGIALLLAGLLVFVALSLNGRGTRRAVGEPGMAPSDGIEIAYSDAGAGPVVVLLASWARPASDFNEIAVALHRAGFRTLAVESRGIAGSGGGGPSAGVSLADLADDVRAVLDAAGVAAAVPVHVVGHAFGNQVVRTFASRHPTRTRSVVLVAAGGRSKVPAELTDALFVASLSFLPWSLREPAVRRAFFAEGNEIPRHWRLGWSLWGGLAQDGAVRGRKAEAFWGAGGVPILVFQAEHDAIAPAAAAGLALAREFPERVTLVSVPGAGHALLPEQPALIADGLVAYLRGDEDRRRARPSRLPVAP
jgi:pimeloyl-ACP methyl ester carboxylesterase